MVLLTAANLTVMVKEILLVQKNNNIVTFYSHCAMENFSGYRISFLSAEQLC